MALTDKLVAIGDAIRAKTGTTDTMTLAQMPELINRIETGSGGFPNGTEWTKCAGLMSSSSYDDIIEAKGRFFSCDSENRISYSDDGITWTYDSRNKIRPRYINYGHGIFVGALISTGLAYSTDGITWTQSNISSGSAQAKPMFGNSVWVAPLGSGLYYSTDGMAWTQCDFEAVPTYVQYGNGIWVVTTSDNGIWYSTDGITWTQSNVTSGNARHPAYADGMWVATVISGGFYYSTDGMTWTQSNITSATSRCVTYAIGMWQIGTTAGIYYSYDAKTWSQSLTSTVYVAIAYGCGVWIASPADFSGKNIMYSFDGITWSSTNTNSKICGEYSLLHAKNVWLIGENNGTVNYSLTWAPPATT